MFVTTKPVPLATDSAWRLCIGIYVRTAKGAHVLATKGGLYDAGSRCYDSNASPPRLEYHVRTTLPSCRRLTFPM